MLIIKVWNESASPEQIKSISRILLDGGVIIWKTDSRYAFACDAMNKKALERVCALKKIKPEKSRLSVACHSISQAAEYVRIDNDMFRMMKENTPGPFTFIFRTGSRLPKAFKERKETGIRIPDSRIAKSIIETTGTPLLTASLPDEDPDYAIQPDLMAEMYADTVDLLIDSGEGTLDETTIVDCTGNAPEIIRQGIGYLD